MEGLVNPLTGEAINNQELKQLSDLVKRQVALEDEITQVTELLRKRGEELKRLSEIVIPETMSQLGLLDLKLEDGTKVQVDTFYAASIPEESKPSAFAWLRSTNNDSIIKRDITCKFGKGEDQAANELTARLNALGYSFNDKTSVHPQTLKAFVREMIESNNKDFPSELFGVFVGKRTKLTPARK